MRQAGLAGVIAAAALGLGGCGSSAPNRHRAPQAGAAAAASNGEASKPAAKILADSAAAMGSAGSYELRGRVNAGRRQTAIAVAITGPKTLEFSFQQGALAADFIEIPGAGYLRGNAALWRPRFGARAPLLAGRWIRVPPSSIRKNLASLGHLAPGQLSRCMVEGHGTLRVAGRTTVLGRPAILIKDAGDVPGSTPGLYAVAATGPPYMLAATATGRSRPGGRIDVCNDGKASDQSGTDLTFSRFGSVPPIQPPATVVGPPAAG